MIKKETVIIGCGPAGLSAAIETASGGADTLIIDENSQPGGQLFKQIHKFFGSKSHHAGVRGVDIAEEMLHRVDELGVDIWLDSTAVGVYDENIVSIKRTDEEGKTSFYDVEAETILFATGGSENAISFPGCTIPGVMGAGAAQTMMNIHRVLPGKKVLMVGSGNVGLIVSYQLLQAGAKVVAVVDAIPRIGGYGVHAAKLSRAGVPFMPGYSIVEVHGSDRVQEVILGKLDSSWNFIEGTEVALDADTVCLAVGLRPLYELAYIAGLDLSYCRDLGGWMPVHNESMETSKPHIYVAGDIAGVEEASTAMDEGTLAGIAILERLGKIPPAEARERKAAVQQRLDDLREGDFGEKRKNAKCDIIKGWGAK